MLINILLIAILIFTLLLLATAIITMIFGVPSLPSNRKTIDLMLKEANLKNGEVIYDLGCGDARLLIKAEKLYGTKGIGYENAPFTLILAHLHKWIRRSNVTIHSQNFFNTSLDDAQKIFLYLIPEANEKLAPKLKRECPPGTTIISNSFHLPGFTPVKKIPKNTKQGTKTVFVYKTK